MSKRKNGDRHRRRRRPTHRDQGWWYRQLVVGLAVLESARELADHFTATALATASAVRAVDSAVHAFLNR